MSDAAINYLKAQARACCSASLATREVADVVLYVEGLEAERDALKARWIPVTERLPMIRTTVLALSETGQPDMAYYYENGWHPKGAWTHWTPLPEPPEPEGAR